MAGNSGGLVSSILTAGHAAGLSSVEQNMILEKLKELQQLLAKCEDERLRNEINMQNIVKTNDRMQNEPQKLYYKQKLKTLYKSAIEDADVETELFYQARELIFDIRSIIKRPRKPGMQRNLGYSSSAQNIHQPKETSMRRGALMKLLHQAAQTLPLFIPMQPSERLPPLCGSVPAESNHISKPGDLVAALVKSSEGDENWILAEVVYFNSQTNKYEIDDIDEEQKERHILSKRRVVALPTYRANPETHSQALFPRKSLVLALYPQTTCFYRAIVQEQPKTPTDQYKVLFEDSSYSEGYSPPLGVPQRYVIMSKDMRKK